MLLEITQTDINKAEPGDAYNCVVARAMRRALKIPMKNDNSGCADRVEVDGTFVEVYRNNQLVEEYRGFRTLSNLVERFDNMRSISPCKIRLIAVNDQSCDCPACSWMSK